MIKNDQKSEAAEDDFEDIIEYDLENARDDEIVQEQDVFDSDMQPTEEIINDSSCDVDETEQNQQDLGSEMEEALMGNNDDDEGILEEEVIADIFEVITTNDNRYQCNLCDSNFKTKDNLRRHIIRHKTTTRFKCQFCTREFYFSRDLNFHLKVNK